MLTEKEQNNIIKFVKEQCNWNNLFFVKFKNKFPDLLKTEDKMVRKSVIDAYNTQYYLGENDIKEFAVSLYKYRIRTRFSNPYIENK